MKFLDLFAGIGGFRLGMMQAQHEPVGWVENDKFARKSYKEIYNVSDEWTARDIRGVKGDQVPEHDVLCAGFPCQDFSEAHEGEGIRGTKGSLFYEMARVAKSKQPTYLFLENVPGILNSGGGEDFEKVLETLDELGYDGEWQSINSGYKSPQSRERVYILGHKRGEDTEPVFPIGRLPRNSPDEIGRVEGVNGWDILKRIYSKDGLCPTITTFQGGNRETFFLEGDKVRKITLREAWRAQGFPDWAFDRAHTVNSDTQLYRQAGNSVIIPIVYEVASRLDFD